MKYTKFKNQQKKACENNLKDILYQEKIYIGIKKKLHSTSNLSTTFHEHAGETNMYFLFRYGQQKTHNHTQGQVSGSMNYDRINANKQVNNGQR